MSRVPLFCRAFSYHMAPSLQDAGSVVQLSRKEKPMIIRTLSILALLASLSAFSAPVFAAEDEIATSNDEQVEATSPNPPPRCEPWMRHCVRPPMRNFACYSRNVL